jgi:Tfp pilus assembly protein PilE
MIAVAIIGVIASVAIPIFTRYQNKSKSAEVKASLGAIRVAQEAYFSEHGTFIAADPEPALIPGGTATEFDPLANGYASLGWRPEGLVYFSYAVAVSPDETGYTADAAADIDGDGIVQIWGYAKPDAIGVMVNGTMGCEPLTLSPNKIGLCSPDPSTF